MRPRINSVANIFANRGDPLVSEKEGRKNYGRNPVTENPDLDQFFLAKKAVPKPVFVDPVRVVKTKADYSTRMMNARRGVKNNRMTIQEILEEHHNRFQD